MATRIKNILRFTNLVVGVPTSIAHNLNVSDRGVIPDLVIPSIGGFTITGDATNVTVTRDAGSAAAVDVFAEYWHTEDRAFGSTTPNPGTQPDGSLVPAPFVMDPTGGGGDTFNYFGDGSDGDVVLVAPTNLARDMHFNSLDTGAFEMQLRGFRLFVKEQLIVAAGGSIIGGGAALDGTSGAGAALGSGGSVISGTTGIGAGGGGGNGAAGTASAVHAGTTTGTGGAGGAGDAGAGGAGGAFTAVPPATSQTPRTLPIAIAMTAPDRAGGMVALLGGAGGGGGNNEVGVAGGGGGGAGGSIVVIAAKMITLAATGIINANGGDGGNGDEAGDAGGGGGGSGGVVSLVFKTLQNAGGTIEAAGGTGGTALGTGVDGSDGDAGTVYQYAV